MSETKLKVKTVGHSEKFSLTSEIFARLAKIRHFARLAKIRHFAIFAKISLCLIAKFFDFFFEKSNKIINNKK